uniref:Secreted protein n=1 Tax=Arundo donax TaxID=35708 RepID=A0A0A9DVS1_ARUDO
MLAWSWSMSLPRLWNWRLSCGPCILCACFCRACCVNASRSDTKSSSTWSLLGASAKSDAACSSAPTADTIAETSCVAEARTCTTSMRLRFKNPASDHHTRAAPPCRNPGLSAGCRNPTNTWRASSWSLPLPRGDQAAEFSPPSIQRRSTNQPTDQSFTSAHKDLSNSQGILLNPKIPLAPDLDSTYMYSAHSKEQLPA